MKRGAKQFALLIGMSALASCQMKEPEKPALSTLMKSNKKPAVAVASIARTAQTCWFKSGDKVFKIYTLANEVNSFAGKPRFLIVPRKNPGGLPLLVVEAEKQKSGETNIVTFGSLLQSPHGRRVLSDVNRWSRGETTCT